MESYSVRCKKYTKNINPRVWNTSIGKTMILSKCATSGSKKSGFIKKDSKGLLSILGLRAQLSKVLFLGDILF